MRRLKHAASTYNPEFYDRQRRRQSTWNVPRIITSYDETLDDHLVLPRGLRDTATRLIEGAGSKVEVDDQRVTGDPLDLSPTFDLGPQQQEAVEAVLPHELGLLVAPPGSGKTVMACAVIAQRTVSTLVLVDRKTLADQWRREITDLLGLKPGQLGGGRSKLTGIVDIATLQTLARRTDLADKLGAYGQVIVDECHHVPAAAFETAVRAIPARYWVGLTATPYRRDGLDDLIGFQLGPVRHTFTHADPDTLEGAGADRPRPVLVVHATSFRLEDPVDLSVPGAIAGVHRALAEDEARNGQILTDVVEALGRGRHCLVLAQRTGHVDHLAAALAERGLDPVVLKGGMGAKQRAAAIGRLNPSDPTRRCLWSRRATSSAKASTVPHSTPCSWQARSRSRAVSSSTPAASSAPTRASRPPRCTTTTTSTFPSSLPHSPSAHPATSASDSPTPEVRVTPRIPASPSGGTAHDHQHRCESEAAVSLVRREQRRGVGQCLSNRTAHSGECSPGTSSTRLPAGAPSSEGMATRSAGGSSS